MAEVEGMIEDDHTTGDAHLAEEIDNMTEDAETNEDEIQNVTIEAEEENAIEAEDDLIVIEGETKTVEEEEKDQEIGMINIVMKDHNNATSTRQQANAVTNSERDMHVSFNTKNQRRKTTATLKVEDPRMAGH